MDKVPTAAAVSAIHWLIIWLDTGFVLFLCGFGQAFFTLQFAFMQSYDDQAKTYGFKSRSMCERIFIMNKELLALTDDFMDHPDFAKWKAVVAGELCRANVEDDLPVPPNVVPSGSFSLVDCLSHGKIFSTRSTRTLWSTLTIGLWATTSTLP
jgi:hypothetical protein